MGSHRAFIILSSMCLTNPPTLHIKSQKYFIFNVHGGLGEGSKAHINLQDYQAFGRKSELVPDHIQELLRK